MHTKYLMASSLNTKCHENRLGRFCVKPLKGTQTNVNKNMRYYLLGRGNNTLIHLATSAAVGSDRFTVVSVNCFVLIISLDLICAALNLGNFLLSICNLQRHLINSASY